MLIILIHLSQAYSDYMVEVRESIPYIESSGIASRLHITTGKVTILSDALTIGNGIYGRYTNTDSHAGAVKDMKEWYDATHKITEDLKKVLKANDEITLTGTDYMKIHIHENLDPRKKVPGSTITPENDCIKTTHCVNRIFTSNPTEGYQAETALPTDVKQVGRKVVYVKHGDAMPARSAFTLLPAIGATTYDIICTPEQAHMQGYLITWYISPTGEPGPECDPYPFDTV